MKFLFRCCLALVTAIGVATIARAEEPHIARESIEWCKIWITDANSGDSANSLGSS